MNCGLVFVFVPIKFHIKSVKIEIGFNRFEAMSLTPFIVLKSFVFFLFQKLKVMTIILQFVLH